ncbi:hypothetical protein [Pseudarthrobacter raffinosi]|uniref:hypothetical protein n=1 Tax=Pseudarthrobacter raffinosi TaxID=2953651 RepID=UPI00208F08D9|nr:hypothetical protein [Pseudarthrobacter sp. MDT3-9]MCO4253602.1 hypothetical protein [Pseudarthrobacter sp. MDT3-9]
MSEETALNLKEAEAHLSAVEKEATERKQELLAAVAEHLPRHAQGLAKRTARSQPEVAKGLGVEGVQKLRSELEDKAQELADDVAGAASQIKWKKPSRYSPVAPNDVSTSLFDFMYGIRVSRLAKVFKDHGFSINDDNNRGSQSLVLPQSLFSGDDIKAEMQTLGTAMMAVTNAEQAIAAAKKADDLAEVDDLWGED